MYVERHLTPIRDPKLQLAAAGLMGTTQKIGLDRLWPVEEMLIRVGFHISTIISAASASQSVNGVENILAVIKHINLTGSFNKNPRTIVDFTGPGLLEYAQQVGMNLDRSTNTAIGLSNQFYNGGGTVVPIQAFTMQITYRIPLTNPMLGEPLRMRTLCPFHLFDNDPVLTIDFASAAEMFSTGAIDNMWCEVSLIRADWNTQREAVIQKNGGWITSDLVENPFGIAPGVSTEQRIPVPIGGSYTNLLMRQYLGGATITRDVLDSIGKGTSFGSGMMNENLWRLEVAAQIKRQWNWRTLQIINDWTRPLNGVPNPMFVSGTSAGSPTASFVSSPSMGGIGLAGAPLCAASSCLIDFLGDGVTGDSTTDLGSVLNANVSNGVKVEIIGTPANVATNASTMFVGGHRLFGDLSSLQAMP